MRLLFTALFALVLAVLMAGLLQRSPGLFTFTYDEWVLQSSLTAFVFVFVVVFSLVYFSLWLIRELYRLPKTLGRWSSHRRHQRSQTCLARGWLAMMEGNWSVAERAFRKGANYSPLPLVNYLGAARAAQLQGEADRGDHYLRLADACHGGSSLAVGITKATWQLDQGHIEQARATLTSLEGEQPGCAQVKRMLLDTTVRLEDWGQAIELLEECESKGLLPLERIRVKQHMAYAGLLRQADRAALDGCWRALPGRLKKETQLIAVYVRQRLGFADTGDCEVLLRHALRRKWAPELVRLYGLVEGDNLSRQLAYMERALHHHPKDAVLLLTLGRLCKKNNLWGKSRGYLERSIDIHPDPEVYQELATLLERQGEKAAAAMYYQKGLHIATSSAYRRSESMSGAGEEVAADP